MNTQLAISLAQRLAEFVVEVRWDQIPPEVRETTTRSLVDTVGVGLLGAAQPEVTSSLAGYLRHEHVEPADAGWGARVFGMRGRVSPFAAGLLNGVLAHALEFDDSHRRGKVHPGAVVIPAALAAAEVAGAGGRDFVAAVAVGYEVMIRVAMALGTGAHRRQGWHATSTAGTFGAAAAAGRLLGLTRAQVTSALGLAGTQSGGLWAFKADGSMAKRFHAGRAAQGGLQAAALAGGGLTGPRFIFEAEDGGFLRAFSEEARPDLLTEGLGERWEAAQVSLKPYPCCRTIHPAIEAALQLAGPGRIPPQSIRRILVHTHSVAAIQNGLPQPPQNRVQAQFSLPYCVAVALAYGPPRLEHFAPPWLSDRTVLDLLARVEIHVSPEMDRLYPQLWPARVEVVTDRGERFAAEARFARGDPEHPLGRDEVEAKFMACAPRCLGEGEARVLLANLWGVEAVTDMGRLGPLAGPGGWAAWA